jgi:RHS repeat-associated protein
LEAGAGQSGYAFTGREWEPEAGLHYYRARYYDPRIGRFISEDPIGLRAGVNLYAYVLGNPVTAVDPFGLDAETSSPFLVFSPFSVTRVTNQSGYYASEKFSENLHEAVHRLQYARFDHYHRRTCDLEAEAFKVEANILQELISALERGERTPEGPDEIQRLRERLESAHGNTTNAEHYVTINGQPEYPAAARFFKWLRGLF